MFRVAVARDLEPSDALPTFEEFAPAVDEPLRPFWGEVGLTSQGLCLVRLARYEEARQVMQRHPGQLMKAIPTDHYERRLYLKTLVEIHDGLGQPEKRAEYQALLREAEEADEASE